MSCMKYQSLIDKAVEDNLTEHERKKLYEHTSYCQSCREELNELQNLEMQLLSIDKIDPPENLKDKVLKSAYDQDLLTKKRQKNVSLLSKICAVAASFLLLFVLSDLYSLNLGQDDFEHEGQNFIVQEGHILEDESEGDRTLTVREIEEGPANGLDAIDKSMLSNQNLVIFLMAGALLVPLIKELYTSRKNKK